MALTKGRENVSWGFKNPSDGWHRVAFQEGVNLKVKDNGKESLYIPMVVDEGSAEDGIKVGVFINTRDENGQPYKSVDQQIADIITNAGLFDMFSKKFEDATTWLDPRIIEALKLKLLGNFVQIECETQVREGKEYCNVKGWAPKDTKHEPKKASEKKADKKADKTTDPDW